MNKLKCVCEGELSDVSNCCPRQTFEARSVSQCAVSGCKMNSSSGQVSSLHIVFTASNGASVLVCLLAVILVCGLRLHKKVVYRLAMYQVLSAFAFALAELLQIVYFSYQNDPGVYDRLCIGIGWLVLYSAWMKLFFTVWVTFHLFCFGVLHKNLKKLELLYVTTSLLTPGVIALIPVVTGSYGPTSGGCYIHNDDDNNYTQQSAIIETFALWDGPAMLILLVASGLMVAMVIKLAHRVYWRRNYEQITEGDQFWKVLKQLLPLAAFPIVFFVFVVPVVIYHIYYSFNTSTSASSFELTLSAVLFISMWSMSSGLILIVHISVVQIPVSCRKLRSVQFKGVKHRSFDRTGRLEIELPVGSATSFPLPLCSVTD